MNKAQNYAGLKTANLISMVAVLAGYIFLAVIGEAYGLHLVLYITSICFSLLNALYYFINEQQRIMIVKNRVFTVYLGALFILFFCILDTVLLIIYSFKYLSVVNFIFSAFYIFAAFCQGATFALMVRKASENVAPLTG